MKLPRYHCQRCGHEWVPRTDQPPLCPHCKSPYWNRPRPVATATKGE